MADKSDNKIYVALGLLAVLGGGYFVQQKGTKERDQAHSVDTQVKALPELALSEEATKKITKIVLKKPAKSEGDDEKPAEENVLVKEGDSWKVSAPVSALANQKNVESLLENLTKLAAQEQVSSQADSYAQYDVSDDKAVHATFYEGDKIVREIWAGKSGGRGQLARVDGQTGVFVLEGYSGFLYNRDTKGWRDLSILELDPEEVIRVAIENENGAFAFEKDGEEWKSKFTAPKGVGKAIKDFESKKLTELLNAYKKLNATGFGEGKPLMEFGLEKPLAKLTIERREASPLVIEFGDTAEGSSRYAKLPEKDQVYTISSWASDWAMAKEEKFQKKEEEEDAEGGPDGMPPGMGMPGGLPPGMQMPPGHP